MKEENRDVYVWRGTRVHGILVAADLEVRIILIWPGSR